MLSRALSLATVMLLVGCLAAERTLAQENLDAGKSPSQIFAGTCNACHKSPRGLLKTVAPGSLSGFLRQHYTTGPAMAGVLANYLVSNGAADTRLGGASPKGAKEGAREEARQDARPATPDQLDRWGRRQHPVTANQEAKPEPAAKPENGQVPSQAAVDRGPDGRKLSAKQGLSNRNKPAAQEESPKSEETAPGEAPKEASAKEESKPEAPKPPDEGSSQSAKAGPSEAPVTRTDPGASAPSTPGLAPSAPDEAPVTSSASAPVPSPPSLSAVVGSEAPTVPLPSSPAPPPAVAAVGPPLPPVAPAGPPVPPISQ